MRTLHTGHCTCLPTKHALTLLPPHTQSDYRGAKQAGLDAVLLRRGWETPPLSDPFATTLVDFHDVEMMWDLGMVQEYVRRRSVL